MKVNQQMAREKRETVWSTIATASLVIWFASAFVSFSRSNAACPISRSLISELAPQPVPAPKQDDSTTTDEDKTEAEKLTELQGQVAESYQLLEQKLFTLQEYERDNNPMRSKLLQRAFVQSQERMTAAQLSQIVSMLKQKNLRDAEQRQVTVLKELESLLQLLESEDRGTRVRDDIRRYQEYLKEIERLGRVQRSIRVQTENNGDNQRIANSQEKAANRTERLAREIRRNEEADSGDLSDDAEFDSPDSSDGNSGKSNPAGKPSDGNQSSQGDGKNPSSGSESKQNDDSEKETNPDDGGAPKEVEGNKPKSKDQPGDEKDQGNKETDDSSDSESGESQPGESQESGKGQPGEPGGKPQQGEPGEPGQSEGQPSSGQQDDGNPVRKRLDQAEKKMREAQQKLEQAKRGDSVEAMREAEREIALAKKELEEILRQLREEEVDRVLAMLEGRFRRMLERQVRVYESTRKLEQTAPQDRDAEFEIRSGKLGQEQNAIATEASRALLLLKEDGSSVAFPETVDQMREDMLQVAERLGAAKIGKITLEIEEDIIDTLDYLIEALVKTQQDMAAMKQNQQQQQQQGGMPGDQPLVDQLAEIKMMRGLQERIYKRHRRYSRLLDDPDDAIGATDDPDLRRALQRLAVRQRQLTDIARDIVNGKNQ